MCTIVKWKLFVNRARMWLLCRIASYLITIDYPRPPLYGNENEDDGGERASKWGHKHKKQTKHSRHGMNYNVFQSFFICMFFKSWARAKWEKVLLWRWQTIQADYKFNVRALAPMYWWLFQLIDKYNSQIYMVKCVCGCCCCYSVKEKKASVT